MIPVTSVVLFKHGVGYFERHGTITGEAAVELSFRASEMNDVLKSLTVLDHDGGGVSSISYESTQPLSKQLEDFAIHIPEGRAISGLLGQLVGTRTVIWRADGIGEVLTALGRGFGSLEVLPVHADAATPAGRILVRAVKGGRAPTRIHTALVLNDAPGVPSKRAQEILAGRGLLPLASP